MTERNITLTLVDGQKDFETTEIEGKLDCVIVDSPEEAEVVIMSDLGYEILKDWKKPGVKYYAPRAVLQGSSKKLIVEDQFDKFHLNERLLILVRGQDQEMRIIIRFD